jgi:hypothetical protein
MIYSKSISLDSLKSITKLLLNNHKQCRVCFEIDNRLYSNFNVEGIFGKIKFETINLETFMLKPTIKILVDISSIENIETFKSNLPPDCHMVITDNGSLGQIMACGVNKLNALRYILNIYGRFGGV